MQRDANSGWSSLYPSFWSGLFAKPSPILEMAVDTDRNILYTRSENSSIQVLPLNPVLANLAELASDDVVYLLPQNLSNASAKMTVILHAVSGLRTCVAAGL